MFIMNLYKFACKLFCKDFLRKIKLRKIEYIHLQKYTNIKTKMLKFICLFVILYTIVPASSTNYWELRRKKYDLLRRIAKPPTIKEIQAKHELMRLRLIRGEPIDGIAPSSTTIRKKTPKHLVKL